MPEPLDRDILAAYQRKLLATLHASADGAEDGDAIIRAMRDDPRLAPFATAIAAWEPRCLETAALLAKRWGRVDASPS